MFRDSSDLPQGYYVTQVCINTDEEIKVLVLNTVDITSVVVDGSKCSFGPYNVGFVITSVHKERTAVVYFGS